MTTPQELIALADVLDRAADLIEPEGKWVTGEIGFDADGHRINSRHDIEKAVCFCAAGAVWRAADIGDDDDDRIVRAAFDKILEVAGDNRGVGTWNDTYGRTQAEVVRTIRAASLRARASQETA